ncbi:hypothetical protein BDF21DRAFT_410247 [Thamnidium elegans]|uniref:CUE domain-containing protein n=1 Tax=Thamnidium elegans TaxID=101142 RepID=A0A8H7SVT8_9FUNG|nr:hypothetical protein INT48_003781 [Thamnidium elegans]KAI8091806.1 hypothetical protein BDF21DRAFT_410247 [Thamnidium elegans]
MVNPFTQTEVDILKEAFPNVEVSVIDDTLRLAKGDVNQAFEMLLNMTDPSQSVSMAPPPLPNRPNNSFSNPLLNPFTSNNAKPLLTVRQELAQWRQDLRVESRQRAECLRNNTSSTPNLSFSNMFRPGCNNRRNDGRHTNTYYVPSVPLMPSVPSVPRFQRPMISVSQSGSPHMPFVSNSSPNVNYTTHSRSSSNPITQFPSNSRLQPCVPPVLPARRQSSNSLNSNYNRTNPFVAANNEAPPMRRPEPATTHYTENEASSFNPFEEAELPPPAYSEIQKDTLVNLQ